MLHKKLWKGLIPLFILIMSSAGWAGGPSGHALQIDTRAQYSNPDRLIVKFKNNHLSSYRRFILRQMGISEEENLFDSRISIMKVLGGNKSLDQLLEQIRNTGFVDYVEPDYRVHILKTPNDPKFGELWGLHNTGQSGGKQDADIDGPEAWDIHTGGDQEVVVGIIDTGVDYTHEDLVANIWYNPGEIAGNGIDDDGNGYVDDIHGIDAHNGDSDPMDDNAHGTHVAGTIGAAGDNGTGVAGVNWNVKIMGLKFLDGRGSGSLSNALTCLDYALKMKTEYGINIVLTSNSWGGGGFSQAMYDAIEASGEAGLLFVAAAGNDSNDNDGNASYPASYDLPNIIAVAATDRNDAMSSFSSYGATTVDLGAPGTDILSTTPGNEYKTFSGTSMATPHVSGAAALVWSKIPGANAQGVKDLLLNTVDPIDSLSGKVLTGGRLNIANAVSCEPGVPRLVISSPGDGFRSFIGKDKLVSVTITDCASKITGAIVTVAPDNSEASFVLKDDGVSPDKTANDGLYSAHWTPQILGTVTLDITAEGGFDTLIASVTGEVIEGTEYDVDDSVNFDWIDATGGEAIDIGAYPSAAEIPIGFDFEFFGISYDRVTVSLSGYLTFGTDGLATSNGEIPSTTAPNNLIAPHWDDHAPSTLGTNLGGAYYLLEGQAPNRRLSIQWDHIGVSVFSGIGVGDGTFEVTLYEGTNDIKFQYKDVQFVDGFWSFLVNANNGASATVGIEGPFGELGYEYSRNQESLSDGMAIKYTVQ